MNIKALCKSAGFSGVLAGVFLGAGAAAQMPDMAAVEKWSKATIIHYEVTGVFTGKHIQIPPVDADLYGDVEEKVTLSFDWDKRKNDFIAPPAFTNLPANVTNLMGMGDKCPAGEMHGAFEYFDIASAKSNGAGAIELTGMRKHPDTMVAESCGAGRKHYAGADKPATEWIGPPDPSMLGLGSMMPASGGVTISPDGKSLVMKAQNSNWVWTYTPSVK